MRPFLEKEKRGGDREKRQMGPRANAAFFPTVVRTTVDQMYPGHRMGEQAASGP